MENLLENDWRMIFINWEVDVPCFLRVKMAFSTKPKQTHSQVLEIVYADT